VGQAVSYYGDMMNTTGLAIMLFLVTHSPGLVATGMIVRALPIIAFGLIAGPIVDRFNRQHVMIVADVARALLTVIIPFLAVRWLPGVFIAVFLSATASSFFNPAKQAILPNLVPPIQLVKANTLMTSSERAMDLAGYAMAGVIAAVVSWAPLFLIDAATYVFSAFTLLGVPDAMEGLVHRHLRILEDIATGMRFIKSNLMLRSTMLLTTASAIFMGLTYPTLVVLSYGPLKAGAAGYGFLEASMGAGAAVGALTVPYLVARYRAGLLILAGIAGFGTAFFLTGVLQNFGLALLFLFGCGAASTIYLVPLVSLTQRESPDYIRGRVMSSRFLLGQTGLLIGMAIAGPLTQRVGSPAVFATAGFLLVCTAAIGLLVPNLRDAAMREVESRPALEAASG
jgi:MFS family permease